jgi:hypothetical protein
VGAVRLLGVPHLTFRKWKMVIISELTDEQIDALSPADVLSLIMRTALRKGDLVLALDAASALAPYRHRQMGAKPWIDHGARDISNATTGNHDDRKH